VPEQAANRAHVPALSGQFLGKGFTQGSWRPTDAKRESRNRNMTSERQVEANRQNAKKSTGPRTPAGKAVVALIRRLEAQI